MMLRKSICVAGSAAALMTLAGCSTGTHQRTITQARPDRSHYTQGLGRLSASDTLKAIAQREATNPSAPQRELVNQVMQGRLVELKPGSKPYALAHRDLDEILNEILNGIKSAEIKELPLNPKIAKGYVRARAAMLNDDAAQAVGIYEQLHQALPGSTEILVGLGDAYIKAGDQIKGADAYIAAIDLGDRSMRALVFAAIGSKNDPQRVIELGTLAWTQKNTNDVSGRLLGGVMLGQALIESGTLTAGVQVMEDAMSLLDSQTARDPRYRRQLVGLYTKRAEQYASLGDTWLLLGRPDRAMTLYELGGDLVNGHPKELMVRHVAAHMLSGHSAMGVIELLGWIDSNPGNSSSTSNRLVEMVGEHPIVGSLLLDGIRERAADRSRPLSHRLVFLDMLLSSTAGPERAGILAAADPEIVSPVSCAKVIYGYEDTAAKAIAAMTIIEASPSIGPSVIPALIRLDGHPLKLLNEIQGESHTAQLMRCLIALDLQRPDLINTLDTMPSDDAELRNHSTSWLIAHGRAALLGARWDLADRLLSLCSARQDTMNGAERVFYVDTLVSGNRTDEAMELVTRQINLADVSPTDLSEFARIALLVGQPDQALDALERALDMDPFSEVIYEKLITLRGPAGSFADTDELRLLMRSLGQRLPDSALTGLLRAHELAGASNASVTPEGTLSGQGASLLLQSQRELLKAHQEHPWRQIGVDLLLSIWATRASQGDPDALTQGLAWIQLQLDLMPGSLELSGAKARLIALNGDRIEAEGFLDGLYERMPSRAVARLHEGLIRTDDSRGNESDALALDRLDGLVSIGDCLERLERAGSSGRLSEFAPDLLIPLSDSWRYGYGQSIRIIRVLGIITQTDIDQETSDLLIELVRRARLQSIAVESPEEDAIDPIDAFNQIDLVVRPTGSDFSMDSYERFVRELISTAGNDNMITIAIQSMMRAGGSVSALDLFTRLSINQGALDEERVVDLASLLGQIGTAEDIEASIERIADAGLLVDARDAVVTSFQTLDEGNQAPADEADSVRADLIYTIGVVASFYDRDDESNKIFRLALSHDVNHAWANNDLGYQLAEKGDVSIADLEEAEGLLILAHSSRPDAANITDSLAWARYAMGIFADELDETGAVTREGAMGLLAAAIDLEDDNATMHDHLGDTLWMTGDFDGALGSWLEAEDRLRARLTELSNLTIANPRGVERIREELSRIRFKIRDGESGRVPGVGKNAAGIPVPMDHRIDD